MVRSLTSKNLFDQKHETFDFDGKWLEAFGKPETTGVWLIWGREKNGKTTFTLMLADYLRRFARVLYVSAEEGTGSDFTKAAARAGLHAKTPNIGYLGYETMDDLGERLRKKKGPKIVVLDNVTVYKEELIRTPITQLVHRHPNCLFIILAHEERGKPYLAPAQLASKLAKVIIHIEGLRCRFTSRGQDETTELYIDEQKAALIHGQK